MRETDLRSGPDQALRTDLVLRTKGNLTADTQLYRVLGIAEKGQTYVVVYYAGKEASGRYACITLRGSGDPETIQAEATMEDFLAAKKLAKAEDRSASWSLAWAALDSLAGLTEASEDDLHRLLVVHAQELCGRVERGFTQMFDAWDKTLPLIKQVSHRRIWHDALYYESWEECVTKEFPAVLTRWQALGAQTERVLELTTGEDAMSNRMAAVVAGTSEWTVRQIRKDAGVASVPTRGKDGKTRKPRTPSAAKPVPVTPAEPPSAPPRPAPEQPQAPAEGRPGAPEPAEPVTDIDVTEVIRTWAADLDVVLYGGNSAMEPWPESLTKDWAATVARCWPPEPVEIEIEGKVIGTLTFTPARTPETAEKFNLVEMERSGQQVTDTSRTSQHGTAEVATEPVIKTAVVNMKGHATDAEFMAELASGQVVYVGHKQARGGWNLDESALANPWHSDKELTQKQKVQKYREYILTKPELLEMIPALRGRMLGCWCAPKPCHADVLAELADASAE